MKENLRERNYQLIPSADAIVLKEKHNFIFVLTPERLLYLLISNPDMPIHYLFVDESHKFSEIDSRGPFYYVEYGTTNPLTILLQRSGFSRETSTYIRQHRDKYVVMTHGGEVKLRRSLLQIRNVGAARESADIQYNMPEIFVN